MEFRDKIMSTLLLGSEMSDRLLTAKSQLLPNWVAA